MGREGRQASVTSSFSLTATQKDSKWQRPQRRQCKFSLYDEARGWGQRITITSKNWPQGKLPKVRTNQL